MKLATLRTNSGTIATRIDSEYAVQIAGFSDVGQLLALEDWRQIARDAAGQKFELSELEKTQWAAVVPNPSKIICVGLNYKDHIAEMGHPTPEFPTLFTKYPEALIGPFDDLVLPPNAPDHVDWETELAVIIGKKAYRLTHGKGGDFIAGYSIMNDVSMRDFQNRSAQWLQGKSFANSAPFGPYLVTADDFSIGGALTTSVNGQVMQSGNTGEQVFYPADLVEYISQLFPLNPGDVIITGTPGGVGHARKPSIYLKPGDVMVSQIEGIGSMENRITK